MPYKKIHTKKIYEEIAELLHEKIRSGYYQAGERIDSVEQLATQFEVSRSAVREALASLKALGLIEIKQGSGTFVKQTEAKKLEFPLSTAMLNNQKSIADLLELRKIIEVGTAESAARHRTNENLRDLREILNKMRGNFGDEELGEKVDFEFHRLLAISSQNDMLVAILNKISGLMIETMKETRRIWLYSKKTTNEKLHEEHVAIFQAIEQQDVQAAKKAMQQHLSNVEDVLIHYYETTHD